MKPKVFTPQNKVDPEKIMYYRFGNPVPEKMVSAPGPYTRLESGNISILSPIHSNIRGTTYASYAGVDYQKFMEALDADLSIHLTVNFKPIDTPECETRQFTYHITRQDPENTLAIPAFIRQLGAMNDFIETLDGTENRLDITKFTIKKGGVHIFDAKSDTTPDEMAMSIERILGIRGSENDTSPIRALKHKDLIPLVGLGCSYAIKPSKYERLKMITGLKVNVYHTDDDGGPSLEYTLPTPATPESILRTCIMLPQVIAFDSEFYVDKKRYSIEIQFLNRISMTTELTEKELLFDLNLFEILQGICKSIQIQTPDFKKVKKDANSKK